MIGGSEVIRSPRRSIIEIGWGAHLGCLGVLLPGVALRGAKFRQRRSGQRMRNAAGVPHRGVGRERARLNFDGVGAGETDGPGASLGAGTAPAVASLGADSYYSYYSYYS